MWKNINTVTRIFDTTRGLFVKGIPYYLFNSYIKKLVLKDVPVLINTSKFTNMMKSFIVFAALIAFALAEVISDEEGNLYHLVPIRVRRYDSHAFH